MREINYGIHTDYNMDFRLHFENTFRTFTFIYMYIYIYIYIYI